MENCKKMEQEFKLLDNGKVEWTHKRDVEAFKDKDFGELGTHGGYSFIVFNSKQDAMTVLDRDVTEVTALMNKHKEDMDKNKHNLDKFSDIKELIESVGKLHNDFKEIKNIPEKLYADNPKKYQKLLREFNSAKDYIVEEMSALNKEYNKYLQYTPAKEAYEFAKEQLEKIEEQRTKLRVL
jgi:hypothetical protein